MGAMTAPNLVDQEACELMTMQIIGFCLALKMFVRDEKITDEELGDRMDRDFVRSSLASLRCASRQSAVPSHPPPARQGVQG